MDIKIVQKLRELSQFLELVDLEEAEMLLENYLELYPQETEAWLRLACLQLCSPISDFYKSIECINSILSYDRNNVDAILLLAFIHQTCLGGVDEVLFNKLDSLKVEDRNYRSMIEYVKSWRYWRTEEPPYEELLIKSTQVCDCHVYNHRCLARYYFKRGETEKGKQLIQIALSNVQGIYSQNIEIADRTSVKELFNEHIKGVHITESNFNSIKEELDC